MQVRVAPPGFAPRVRLTVFVEAAPVVTTLPPASVIATTGCVGNGCPAVEATGWTVKTSLVAGPPVTAKGALSAKVSPLAWATSTYGLAVEVGLGLSIAQPAKLARPATTVLDSPPEQTRMAPVAPVPGLIDSVTTVAPSCVAVAEAPARTATTGWVLNAMPPAAPAGWVVKARRSATSNSALVAEASPVALATSV